MMMNMKTGIGFLTSILPLAVEPFLYLDLLPDIERPVYFEPAVDPDAFSDIRVLLCDHVVSDLAPVPDAGVPVCPDVLADLRGLAHVHISTPEAVIDLAELADHDIPVGLDAVLLQLRIVRKKTVVMPVLFDRSFMHPPAKSGPELVCFVDKVKCNRHQVATVDP